MPDEAVSPGIRATVTSAAAVMIGVFSIVATLSSLDFKEMDVGLASAVLIDATIVRAVLLPASMKPLGDRNFWVPAVVARVAASPGGRGRARTGGAAGASSLSD